MDVGLTVLRASRLEALLTPLQTLLEQTRPEHPLVPQTVVAAHPGMKQWLGRELARQVGPARIVANLNVQLPSSWLDGLSATLLGERAVALPHYRRTHLRWTLHALLEHPQRWGLEDPRVLDYLQQGRDADERALRRFQLADRLARVYSQYLVYRGDWLLAWETGRHVQATARQADAALRALEKGCLAPLWQAVRKQLGPHRASLAQDLVHALGAHAGALEPLHVFGLSHLPPAELSILRTYARRAPVFLYVPDPCREYWGGLYPAVKDAAGGRRPDVGGWNSFREEEQQRLENPDVLAWHDQAHPLLARWGRLGQHFFAALVEDGLREDIRHWQDEDEQTPESRLARVQDSIRRLEPELMQEDATAPEALQDASLRVHACHTRLRELEVLHDALLDALEQGIRPDDIVVMAPDIGAYLPLIPAVFGDPGHEPGRRLPYHLADVPMSRSHRLFVVFDTLLALATSRITAPDVADLLGVPEVQRALGLEAAEADTLVEWLRQSRVAWALDGAHKQALSLPPQTDYSFAWAMDRMLAGYLMADPLGGTDSTAVTLPDTTELLPLAGVEGPTAAALGKLDHLLCELQAWRDLTQVEQPASQWAVGLQERVNALLAADSEDADAVAALASIRRAIAQLAAEPAANGQDPLLRLPVVRELLQETLCAVPERQRFLSGGITFCGMVPQRAIPFQMVCVLGLDEGAFPRRPADGGIDLMARLRRVGDRDVVSDDRYLFLETLMSARKRLHLSYVGQGVRDGKRRNPAMPLAELLAELDMRCGIAPEDEEAPRPWWVWHPLQPFDARYFDGSHPALFSYSSAFFAMQGEGRRAPPRLRDHIPSLPTPLPDPLPLEMLETAFKDPAKALLKDHLQLSLDVLDEGRRLPEEEPLKAIPPIHQVAQRVFLHHVLPRKCADPEWQWDHIPPPWVRLGGVLPPGRAGEVLWQQQVDAVEALWHQADAWRRFDSRGQNGRLSLRVDVLLGDDGEDEPLPRRITGVVTDVFPLRDSEAGVQIVSVFPDPNSSKCLKKPEALGFKECVPAFLRWALLRLQRADTDLLPAPVRLTMLALAEPELARQVNAWDEAFCIADAATRPVMREDLRRRLCGLVRLLLKMRRGNSWFYPKSGWEAVRKLMSRGMVTPMAIAQEDIAAEVAKAVAGVWQGFMGERDYAPGYAWLLEGDLVFGDPDTDPDRRALAGLVEDALTLHRLISLHPHGCQEAA